jgi:hypothetical protein
MSTVFGRTSIETHKQDNHHIIIFGLVLQTQLKVFMDNHWCDFINFVCEFTVHK